MADFLCTVPVIAAMLGFCAPPPPLATGYVEGEFVQVAPLVTARIEALAVRRGDRIEPGQLLAAVEDEDAGIAVASAEAAVQRAKAELADLQEGSRPEEIAALEAAVAAARANAERTTREADRQTRLSEQRVTSQAQLEAARGAADMAVAAVAEAEARLETARLPARGQRIAAARAAVAQAEAALEASRWQLAQRRLRANAPGTVTDILRHPGEVAGPSAPVLSWLPDGAVKLRVFLAEGALSSVAVGTRLAVECDGCRPLEARVTWIADRAEFTPPVIYSREARQKLVYMVEAVPIGDAALKPGQIVEVRPSP